MNFVSFCFAESMFENKVTLPCCEDKIFLVLNNEQFHNQARAGEGDE
jgi:hypothetical protein